jgi:hypothetical protein
VSDLSESMMTAIGGVYPKTPCRRLKGLSGRLVALDGGAEVREGHVQRQGDLPDGRP